MHARAQDDTHFAAKTHVGSAVHARRRWRSPSATAPTATAFAVAVLAGCEVAAAVGERLAAADRARLPRHAGFGTLGAAAACASLLGSTSERAANAIAIAASFSGGLNQTWIDGTSEYRAASSAWRPATGSSRRSSRPRGLPARAHWYEGAGRLRRAPSPATVTRRGPTWELGERWRMLDVTYKPYPVCAITQSPVAGRDRPRDRARPRARRGRERPLQLNPADRSYPGTLNRGPFNDVGASLMSAQFCVAMALKHRAATLAGLREFEDPVIRELVARTEVLADEGLPTLGGRVEVELTRDGTELSGRAAARRDTYGWDWDGVRRQRRAPGAGDGGRPRRDRPADRRRLRA